MKYLLLMVVISNLYAEQRLKIKLTNDTMQTLAYFTFAVDYSNKLEKTVRLYGYAIIPAYQKECLGWDFFPVQNKDVHYFSAILKIQNGKITGWATPKRLPAIILSIPCYNHEKSIYFNSQPLKIRDVLNLAQSQSMDWKQNIVHYWLSYQFIPLQVPFALLHTRDDDSDLLVYENSVGDLLFEIHKHR